MLKFTTAPAQTCHSFHLIVLPVMSTTSRTFQFVSCNQNFGPISQSNTIPTTSTSEVPKTSTTPNQVIDITSNYEVEEPPIVSGGQRCQNCHYYRLHQYLKRVDENLEHVCPRGKCSRFDTCPTLYRPGHKDELAQRCKKQEEERVIKSEQKKKEKEDKEKVRQECKRKRQEEEEKKKILRLKKQKLNKAKGGCEWKQFEKQLQTEGPQVPTLFVSKVMDQARKWTQQHFSGGAELISEDKKALNKRLNSMAEDLEG